MGNVPAERSKPIIGLVGGIGSGKTTVARIFESLGAALIDSDTLAHEELQAPEVMRTIRSWWGDSVQGPGGEPNREAIAAIVFREPAELERLEKLLYPRIHRRREELVTRFEADPAVRAVVLDAPKLYEAGLEDYCDAVVFVDCPRVQRLRRVQATRNWTEEELERRESRQLSLAEKKTRADHCLSNHAGLDRLRAEVERIFSTVLAAFGIPG